ncbi:thioesterase [Hanstruepera neustonica]|uniref:Thioesterase n=1 Tax=Hanstruepera neustonica TaxID=1445657 RepID=A0A2K1E3Q6_9FLAO|nr:acyl-CoA thioesterase [Hanstruepera neustonica]PNQ74918.1 thioesterase [Hanstruepera neustonica]
MFTKEFEIRWNDLDANMHLANASYMNFMSHTRMAFFEEFGFSLNEIAKHELAPIVFNEHIYYFKEAHIGDPITVGLEVTGLSEDGMFFSIEHNFYDKEGKNIAHCEMLGAWMNFKTRKLTKLNEELMACAKQFPKSKDFKVLTKEDTRKNQKRPIDLTF